jgi:hypothetical protein
VGSTERLMATVCIFPDFARRVPLYDTNFHSFHRALQRRLCRHPLLVFSVRLLGGRLRWAYAGSVRSKSLRSSPCWQGFLVSFWRTNQLFPFSSSVVR